MDHHLTVTAVEDSAVVLMTMEVAPMKAQEAELKNMESNKTKRAMGVTKTQIN